MWSKNLDEAFDFAHCHGALEHAAKYPGVQLVVVPGGESVATFRFPMKPSAFAPNGAE